jgi:hypothetical protein
MRRAQLRNRHRWEPTRGTDLGALVAAEGQVEDRRKAIPAKTSLRSRE